MKISQAFAKSTGVYEEIILKYQNKYSDVFIAFHDLLYSGQRKLMVFEQIYIFWHIMNLLFNLSKFSIDVFIITFELNRLRAFILFLCLNGYLLHFLHELFPNYNIYKKRDYIYTVYRNLQIKLTHDLRNIEHFIIYSSMLSILDLFSFKQTVYQLDPTKYLYRLGNQCTSCKKKMSYGQSITICNCNMFAHQKCFIKVFQQIENCDQRSKIICTQCKADIKIQYCSQIKLRPRCSFKCIFTLSLIIILIFLFFLLIFQKGVVVKQINSLILTVQLLGVVTLLVLAFLIIISSLYQKESRILSLQKSKKKIIISAFDHIITQPDDDTQNQFVFIPKDRKQQQDTI